MNQRNRRFALIGAVALIILFLCGLLAHYVNKNYSGVRRATPFLDAHRSAVTSFSEQEGFGKSRMRRKRFWNEYSVVLNDVEYPVAEIHLLGADNTNSPVLYKSPRPPSKTALSDTEQRQLTKGEMTAWRDLQNGNALSIIKDSDDTSYKRVMAPIVAEGKCADCHRAIDGSLLGAFIYSLEASPRFTRKVK